MTGDNPVEWTCTTLVHYEVRSKDWRKIDRLKLLVRDAGLRIPHIWYDGEYGFMVEVPPERQKEIENHIREVGRTHSQEEVSNEPT